MRAFFENPTHRFKMMKASWEGRLWLDANNFHSDFQGRVAVGHSIASRPGKFQEKKLVTIPHLRMLSYAVLADFKTPFFFHTIHKAWENRFKTIMEEIACYAPDIVCLQDMDRFSDAWAPAFMLAGYHIIFHKRTEIKDLHDEGIAMAVRRDRFRIISSQFVDLNNTPATSKGPSFADRCLTDDIGMIVFVQPLHGNDFACPLCIGCLMLSSALVDEDVRSAHVAYFLHCIELANASHHAPVLLGCNLNDKSSCMAYTLLRTGREALSGQVPPKVRQPISSVSSRTSALVQWYPPKLSIADPGITSYRISWRTGGNSSLGFYEEVTVSAGDCIGYVETIDANRNRRVVAKEQLQFTVTRLSAEVAYEFRVSAINPMGMGPWSESAEPLVLPNPNKVIRLNAIACNMLTALIGDSDA